MITGLFLCHFFDVVDEHGFDVFDVFGEDDEEGAGWQAGVVDFLAETDAWDQQCFFILRFDGVGFRTDVLVAHVLEGLQDQSVLTEGVVERLETGAGAL